jgi:CheY-like chemotaxis protein
VSDQLIPPQILHVDDDREALDDVRDFLQGEEIPGWGTPKVTGIQSFDDALAVLEARRFDLMVLDVRLGGHEEQEVPPEPEEGARTLEQVKQRRFLPVIFWTGLPAKVEHLASPLIHVLEKGDLDALIETMRELFATRLPALNRALRHLIEDEQRRYMWEFVAEHWEDLRANGDDMALAYLLVRRLGRSLSGPGIERVAAELGQAGPPPPANKIHAAEMYIVPPLQNTEPGVADLFCERSEEHGDLWWLVVTPSCDLEQDNVEWVVLAACAPLGDDPRLQKWRESESAASKDKLRGLLDHKTGGQADRNLYLPRAPTIPDLVADFQRLRSVTRDELDEMERVASLVSPFAEAAVSRFTRYFGRVGTDDLDVDAIMVRLRDIQPGA